MILLTNHKYLTQTSIQTFSSATRFKITVHIVDKETGDKIIIIKCITESLFRLFTYRFLCQFSAQLPNLESTYFITWHGGEGISFNLVRDLAGVPWRHCSRLYTVRRRRATQKDGSCFFKSYLWFRCAIGVLILSCIDCLLVLIERFVTPAQC